MSSLLNVCDAKLQKKKRIPKTFDMSFAFCNEKTHGELHQRAMGFSKY